MEEEGAELKLRKLVSAEAFGGLGSFIGKLARVRGSGLVAGPEKAGRGCCCWEN